jgi:GTP cyclohydrolase II
MIPWVRSGLTFANVLLRRPPVRSVASAKLPTDYGEFDIHVFKNAFSGETHVALVRGEIGKTTRLLSNNPKKLAGVTGYGLSVSERLPIEIPPTASTSQYLRTKKEKLGHLFSSV